MAQIQLAHWSQSRIFLVGDAAYYPSPFSGQGTSLALVGSYVLAAELTRADTYSLAFERYQSRMTPYVDLNEALATTSDRDTPRNRKIARYGQVRNFP